MKPKSNSKYLLGATRSKGKMYEFSVPPEEHIDIKRDPANLFALAIANLGDTANSLQDTKQPDDKSAILFSAHFFDSYVQSKLAPEVKDYVSLLGSCAYFLADLPGSSTVMAKGIGLAFYRKCSNLEKCIIWMLRGNYQVPPYLQTDDLSPDLYNLISLINSFIKTGKISRNEIFSPLKNVKRMVYSDGSPRDLLMVDLLNAITERRISSSTWIKLPEFSGVSLDKWRPALSKPEFVKELWQSQMILGENGVFRGTSAVIQMPTSAGKTKSIEIIIRSSFLAKKTKFAVVVAPFRALCHEIRDSLNNAFEGESVLVDELTDVNQEDYEFSFDDDSTDNHIFVLTPEKLIYILRKDPTLASHLGLMIFDEAHQFDSGIRGVTYELLLSTLKTLISDDTQKILISAVIENAKAIGDWLNGDSGVIVSSLNLQPTYRTFGFASWVDQKGKIQYVDSSDIDKDEFFVPWVLEQTALERPKKKPTKRKTIPKVARPPQLFPDKEESSEIALYLGLKLVRNGSVALFCGLKSSALKISNTLVKIYDKNFEAVYPISISHSDELENICSLLGGHLGTATDMYKAAKLGVLNHHSYVPHGIRLCIEHAMRTGHAKFVICTSTLAQGVNLPIRYLIFSSVYQAGKRLKVRDFHNLIGRAGRAGMHTEGSILLADPELFDKKKEWNPFKREWVDSYHWRETKKLVDPKNSEPCASNLHRLFDDVAVNRKTKVTFDTNAFLDLYIKSEEDAKNYTEVILSKVQFGMPDDRKTILSELNFRIQILKAIESHILANQDNENSLNIQQIALATAKETLAYSLANASQKSILLTVFKKLADNINDSTSEYQRAIFKKSLLGVSDLKYIETWTDTNMAKLNSCSDIFEVFECVWPLIEPYIKNSDFNKLSPDTTKKIIAKKWLAGDSYIDILSQVENAGSHLKYGKQSRSIKVEHIVDICDGGISYDGMLIVGVIIDFLEFDFLSDESTIKLLKAFQKNLKYGLPNLTAVRFYELGFCDRILAQELTDLVGESRSYGRFRTNIIRGMDIIEDVLERYPAYFREVRDNMQILE